MSLRKNLLPLCVLLAFATCDTSKPVAPPVPRLADLVIADGNNQSAQSGQPLPRPLAVRALDQDGRSLSGVKVTFRVTAGGGALSDTVATTGSEGLAQTRLTLGAAVGVNTVVALVDGLSGLSPTFTATVPGTTAGADTTGGKPPAPTGGAPASVLPLSVTPTSLGVRGSGRQETAVLTFEVRDAAGLLVADGEEVAFTLAPAGSAALSATRVTTVSGRVSVTLRSDTLAVPARVTAVARGISGAASVPILGGPPDRTHFSLAPETLNLPGGVTSGLTNRITAFVFDRFSNPVPAGTAVLFGTTAGGIEGSAVTDAQGTATVSLITAEPLPKDGFAVITARVVGRGDSLIAAQTRVLFSGPTQLDVQPAALISDTLRAFKYTVRDPIGNPLSEGTRIQVTAQNGGVLGDVDVTLPDLQEKGAGRTEFGFAVQRAPNARTEVTVAVTSPNGDRRNTILVEGGASGGGGSGVSAPARLAIASADTTALADGVSTMTFTATITGTDGAPIRGTAVEFFSGAGLISASGVTNAAGQASAILTSAASAQDLRVLVRAFASDLRDSVIVRMVGLTLDLASSPDTIAADGNAQSRIVATLRETVRGAPVPFARVGFETSLGTLSTPSALTERDGKATVILTSTPQAGRATVTSTYGAGLIARRQVAFVKGPPASIVLVSVAPPAIGVKGAGANATAFITFEARDAQGTPVSDGERIAFSLDSSPGGESLSPAESATVNGRVRVAFNSGTVAGTVRVIARWAEGPVSSTPVPVAIHGGLPDLAHFSLAPRPVNLAGRVHLGLQSIVTAYVFDKYSNPVPTGTSVRFRTDGGGIQGSAETDADGQGSVLLFTAAPIPTVRDSFLARITGQTMDENGRQIETSTTVLFSGPTVVRLTGAGSDTVMEGRLFIPDSASRIITFTVSDPDDRPIMGGSTIKVTSDVARVSGDADAIIPDARSGNMSYFIAVGDPAPKEDPGLPPQKGSVLINIRSMNGDRLLSFPVMVD